MASGITIEQTGSKDFGVCACCGRSSRRVWGNAHADGACIGAFYVHWTLGHVPDRGANFDLILGAWGEGAGPDKRVAVAMAYRLMESGPTFMVIDAATRSFSNGPLVGQALRRDQVIGTPRASEAFAIADAVLAQDERVGELLGGWKVQG